MHKIGSGLRCQLYLGAGESGVTGNKPGEETALGDGPDQGGKRKVFVEGHLLSGRVGVTTPAMARLLGVEGSGWASCRCDGCGDC